MIMEEIWEVVTDMRIMNPLIRKGLIIPADDTGTKIHGLYSSKLFTCYYIDSVPSRFTYKGYEYKQECFDGCFNPYLMRKKLEV